MFRLALHWQILLGMLAGSLIGLGLNLTASTRTVTLSQGLPPGIVRATVVDTVGRTEIQYIDGSDRTTRRVIDPTDSDAAAVGTAAALQAEDAVAFEIYRRHGRSLARYLGDGFKSLGGLFLRLLQMVAVPLIVTSLLTGIIGLGVSQAFGRIFRRTIVYYLATSALAIVTGLLVVNLIRPGLGNPGMAAAGSPAPAAVSMGEILFQQLQSMIPANPLAALVEPDYLSIICFTMAFGLFTISVGGRTAERISAAADAGFEVMMAMTAAIIRLAPLGVLFLMAHVTATEGADVFGSLGWYMLAVALGLAIHAIVTLPLIIRFVARRNPLEFAQAMSPALLTAFSSASSNGTLPLTLSSAEQRAGISNRTGSFVLPLGATVNMDGTALYEAVAVLFIAQLHFGVNLPLGQQVVVAVMALLASIGSAGIPHAGLVMMAIILQAVGLPVEMQGVVLSVDRILDMMRTSVNVWSDACGCAVVERWESTAAR
jgi:Na+/H+-dicarboxylate symporter